MIIMTVASSSPSSHHYNYHGIGNAGNLPRPTVLVVLFLFFIAVSHFFCFPKLKAYHAAAVAAAAAAAAYDDNLGVKASPINSTSRQLSRCLPATRFCGAFVGNLRWVPK